MHGPIQSHNTVPLKKLLTFYFMQDREPSGEDAHLQHQKDVSQDLTGQVLPQGLSLLCADLFAVLVYPRPVCVVFTSSFFINFEFCLVFIPKFDLFLICTGEVRLPFDLPGQAQPWQQLVPHDRSGKGNLYHRKSAKICLI